MTPTRTWFARLAAVVVIAAGLGIGVATAASAHDVLVSSDPAEGSALHVVPTTMSFTFDQPVQNFDPVVSLIGPDGKQYATGTPQISGNVVTGNVVSTPPGAYVAAYRIVSADGHPVTGEVHFTVAAGATSAGAGTSAPAKTAPSAGAATPAATASPAASAASAASAAGGGGLSTGLWIGLIVAALVIAAAAVILLRRPSGGRPAADAGAKSDKDY